MPHKLNREEFIERAVKIHGDKYDYSQSIYCGSNKLLNIICRKHGQFSQTPDRHWRGQGCSKCAIERNTINKIVPKELKEQYWMELQADINKYYEQHYQISNCDIQLNKQWSYILGFLQTDGWHTKYKNRSIGTIGIQLSSRDQDIIFKIKQFLNLPNKVSIRVKDTNFKKHFEACSIVFNGKYISPILEFLPNSKKSEIIEPPNIPYSEVDYWRGIIDGDGSLGLRYRANSTNKEPFISLITKSDKLASSYQDFLFKMTYTVNNANKNKRDQCYNIAIAGAHAANIVNSLYYSNCFGLDRKINKSNDIKSFTLTPKAKAFSRIEDAMLLYRPLNELFSLLDYRDPATIRGRIKWLKNNNIINIEDLYNRSKYI